MEQKMVLKKLLLTAATAGVLGLGALAASSQAGNAYIVCNRDGADCWHSDSRDRAQGIRFEYHPDDWYFHRRWDADRDHHWHDYREGRGYWRNGVWITL
jgi:hypothetical protein